MTNKTAKKPKFKKVTRKFLFDLADKIYNPKTKQALNLCKGTLSNGPDPVDGKRTMHCGLGELHFAITGENPPDWETEENVVLRACEQSSLVDEFERRRKETVAKLKKEFKGSPILADMIDIAQSCDGVDFDEKGSLGRFELILDSIPRANDKDKVDDEFCTLTDYKNRARRVATKFRQAARLLPE